MVDGKNRWLSKSQINTWKQCPARWKYRYIDRLPSKSSAAMFRGIKAHKQIEEFYKNIKSITPCKGDTKIIMEKDFDMSLIENFKKFEEKRYDSCTDFDKHFKPMYQELGVKNDKLKLRGFIDAVYINPDDGGIIIIDWKTGKYRPDKFSDYRFELAMYKELFEKQTGEIVKYWGIYFVDADKLFFEQVKPISIKAMYKSVQKTRDGIDAEEYPFKPGILCKWCEFSDTCEAWK